MKKLNIIFSSLLVAAAGFLASCSEQELVKADIDSQNAVVSAELPVIAALAVDTVDAFNAVINVTIKGDYENIMELNVVYADNDTLGNAKVARVNTDALMVQIPADASINKEEGVTFQVVVSGLSQNTEYYFTANAYVRNNPVVNYAGELLKATTAKVYDAYCNGLYSCGLFGQEWEQTMEVHKYEPNVYRLPDYIAPGYDLVFSWDQESNEVALLSEAWETGYIHPSYGMITALGSGMAYDAATKTFTFAVEYVVAAGSFGGFNDTFKITE